MSECLGQLLQPYSADLSAIAALVGTGYARKTGLGAWALDTVIPTSRGGTGLTTYVAGDLLYANISGTLSRLPEPGLPGYVLGSVLGQPTWQQLSTLTATTITGTANQVLVNGTFGSGQTGPVTLTLPQGIATTSSPTFAALTVTGTVVGNSGQFGSSTGADLAVYAYRNNAVTSLRARQDGAGSIAEFSTAGGANIGVFSASGLSVTSLIATDAGAGITLSGGGTLQQYYRIQTSGGNYFMGANDSAGSALLVGTGPYALCLQTASNRNVAIGVNNTLIGLFEPTGLTLSGSLTTTAPSGSTARPWKLGDVNAVTPTAPNRTVAIDVNGTVLYLHAKTTND